MGRLNQLQLTDDTRIGFALVAAFILLDTYINPVFGGWYILHIFQDNPAVQASGWLQTVMLVATAGVFGMARAAHHRAMRVERVEKIDPTLTSLATGIAARYGRRRVDFYVSPNILDMNAVAIFSARAPCVVLGGGLRREARRSPLRAGAVIAHECAHIDVHDTVFLLFTWYLFLAYAVLAGLNLVLGQIDFWSHERLASVDPAGAFNFLQFLFVRRHLIFNAGFSNLISVVGVGVALIHFIKQREYRADEAASQLGFRGALVGLLTGGGNTPRPAFLTRLLARFHPTAQERRERLVDERRWARFDWLYVASLAFAISRVRARLPNLASTISLPSMDGVTVAEAISVVNETLIRMLHLWNNLLEVVLLLALAFVFSLHTYRVSATQYKLGVPLAQRITLGLDAMSAIFCGTFVAVVTQSTVLRGLTDPYLAGPAQIAWSDGLDNAIYSACIAIPGLILTVALVLLTPLAMRLPSGHRLVRAPLLLFATLAVIVVLQAVASVLLVGSAEVFGVQYGRIAVAALPTLSQRLLPQLPNILELAVFSVWAYAVIVLIARFGDWGKGLLKKQPVPSVHASRLAADGAPNPLGASCV